MNKQFNNNYYIICLLSCFLLSYLVLFKSAFFSADYVPYIQIYDGTYEELDSIEPAFKYLTYLFYHLSIPYDFFAMLVCGFCLSYKVFYSKKIVPATHGMWFLVVYMCFFGFLHELTQLRIAIAVVMCYAASYQYFFKRNRVHALLWIAIGMLFHYSVFIWGLSLLINSYRRLLIIIISMIFSLAILLSSANIIAAYLPNEKLISYLYNLSYSLNSGSSISFINTNTVTFLLIYVTIAFFRKRVIMSDSEQKFVTYVQCSGILAFFFFYTFSNVPVIAYRLAELLRIFYPLIIVLLMSKLKNSSERFVFGFLFIVYSLLMLVVTFRAVSFGS